MILGRGISIHALLAESDPVSELRVTSKTHFYPRSPCGERQPSKTRRLTNLIISIHALLAESDLTQEVTTMATPKFLSTLSLRRATIVMVGLLMCSLYFYPRSPCGERPHGRKKPPAGGKDFYPRSPCGERRHRRNNRSPVLSNFYPRSPCGERPPPYNLMIYQR